MQHQNSTNDVPLTPMVSFMAKKHILLLHAGGDSKRVPWANPMGKVFLPLPYLAADDPDGPVPLLFDHILAIASCARQAFKNEGCLSCLLHLSENFATSSPQNLLLKVVSPFPLKKKKNVGSSMRKNLNNVFSVFVCLLSRQLIYVT